ncbi:hypothetical protein G7054_g13409 [Neopestalotiopsis clavispora]|nr:hypothetical protein G7054_g13409 [Neopestalotiopsis clavispora]
MAQDSLEQQGSTQQQHGSGGGPLLQATAPLANSSSSSIPHHEREVYEELSAGNAVTLNGRPQLEPEMRPEPNDLENDSASVTTSSDGLSRFSTGLSVDQHSDDDNDSSLGDERPYSTLSATSSIFDFVEEHGRTYHKYKEGKYWMPNDEAEQGPRHRHRNRDMGIRVCPEATENPQSDVLGTDVSPIQPYFVPTNCRFEVDDVEDEWVYSYKFDYVHARHMVGSIKNFPALFSMVYENLNPGGWVEFQDYYVKLQAIDDSLNGTALQRWNNMLNEALSFTGRSGMNSAKYKRQMEEAGFQDVTEHRFSVPGNPWAKGREKKSLGLWQMQNILDGLHGISMVLLTKFLNMSPEAVEVLLVDVRKDIQNPRIHFYYPVLVVYGRRP